MEQTSVWDEFSRYANDTGINANDGSGVWRNGANNVRGRTVPTLLCPSDGEARNKTNQIARLSYRGNLGDGTRSHDMEIEPFRGTIIPGTAGNNDWAGAVREIAIGLSNISDGTTNTLLFTESCVTRANAASGQCIKGGIAADLEGINENTHPIDCMNRRGTGGTLTGVTGWKGDDDGIGYVPGHIWTFGTGLTSHIVTVLPPNAPTCIAQKNDGWIWGGWHGHIATASSHHPGGVSAVLADGSGRFITDSVDTGSNFSQASVESGASRWGVWGALGSRDGGESASLP